MEFERIRKNIQLVMDEYLESNQAFSLKTGISMPSLSHILSSRNKPTLDVILKIIGAYPEVSLDWLLLGKGSIKKVENNHDLGELLELIIELKMINKLNNSNLASKINQLDKVVRLQKR